MAVNNNAYRANQDLGLNYSYEDVVKLVQKLYLSRSPQDVSFIENVLQKIQRSPQGWQFADALLQSRDDNVRFFGALTFTIKIKLDWESLSGEDAALLLDRLLLWLVQLVNAEESSLVLRKLCGSLVAYFLRPSVSWEHCVRHLMCCLSAGIIVPRHSLPQYPPTVGLVIKLSRLQLLTGVWFCSSLIEEVGKTDNASVQTHHYHDKVVYDIDDVINLLQHTMNIKETQNIDVSEEAIRCYQAWVLYAHRAWIDKALELGPLRVLTPFALYNLTIPAMFYVTAESLTDLLSNFPAFFTNSDFESLAVTLSSEPAQVFIANLKAGDFGLEPMTFARLLFAYGDAIVQDLAKDFENPNSKRIIHQLLELLGCEGYAGAEDEACSQCLEFWTTFTEFLIDSLFAAGEDIPLWMENARQYIPKVIEACLMKIMMPSPDVFATWDSDARASFNAFRSDVEDLLQSSYTLLGIDIFVRFAHLALESLKNHAWLQLEATLFCLSALSESISNDGSFDVVLSGLFSSSLFADLASSDSIPPKTSQTAMNVITNYTSFFERHMEFLPSMLNFLFQSLKSHALASVAAKAIFTTCWACRKPLVPEISTFLRQYEMLLSWDNVGSSTKGKVMGAIAAIIQALPTDEDKVDPTNLLLSFVERDVQTSKDLTTTGQYEQAQTYGLCALRCLANMGKAFQLPDEVAIDLDAETEPSTVWEQGRGALLQAKIIELINAVIGSMMGDSDIMEAACQVLRTGFKENMPGPFVFPAYVTENFVTSSNLGTARLDCILDTAGAMLSRYSNSPAPAVEGAALTFLVHLFGIIRSMDGNPAVDPEVASSCIDLAEKMIPNYLHVFLNIQVQESIPNLFRFSLRCLALPEIMPKRSAAWFWTSFVQTRGLANDVQRMVDGAMQEYGLQLSHALVMNIGGEAARSELGFLAEPLKKLVSSQTRAKSWLSDALTSDTFPSRNVGAVEKRVWLQKVMSLRGARGTNQVVKEFWMACRGTNLSYVS